MWNDPQLKHQPVSGKKKMEENKKKSEYVVP